MFDKQLPGDVLLVRGHEKVSDRIVQAQRLLGLGSPSFSHAMICHSPYVMVQSDDGGVEVESYFDLFARGGPETQAPYSPAEMKAYRLRRFDDVLPDDFETQTLVQDTIEHFLGQAYNSAIFLCKLYGSYDTSSFCSELVAKVYARLGQPIFEQEPHWVFPVHLQALKDHPNWMDVTEVYRQKLPSELIREDIQLLPQLAQVPPDLFDERKDAEWMRDFIRKKRELFGHAVTVCFETLTLIQTVHAMGEYVRTGKPTAELHETVKEQVDLLGAHQWYWDSFLPTNAKALVPAITADKKTDATPEGQPDANG